MDESNDNLTKILTTSISGECDLLIDETTVISYTATLSVTTGNSSGVAFDFTSVLPDTAISIIQALRLFSSSIHPGDIPNFIGEVRTIAFGVSYNNGAAKTTKIYLDTIIPIFAGNEVEIRLICEIDNSSGAETFSFSGIITISADLTFAVSFSKIVISGVETSYMTLMYLSGENTSIDLQKIALKLLPDDIAKIVPAITIPFADVRFFFEYSITPEPSVIMFGLLKDSLDLGGVNAQLRGIGVDNAGFIYAPVAGSFTLPKITQLNGVYTISPGETMDLEKGFNFSGTIKGDQLSIDTSKGDGFIAKSVPPVSMSNSFGSDKASDPSATGLFSKQKGIHEFRRDVHWNLGPVDIDALYILLGLRDSKFILGLAIDIKLSLSVIEAVVQDVGIEFPISLPAGGGGNLGFLDIGFQFKPTTGAGLSIDAGVVTGGGFVFFNPDKGEYGGALEITIADLVSVKAICLISTRMPDGSKDFSIIVIISAEFSPVQLGYGFMLTGIGGILGLNRTMDENALIDGVRTNALQSILFPPDLIGNVEKIISDIAGFFPPRKDHFIIGLMLKINWAELVDIEVGVIVDIPNPVIAIVGIVKMILPTQHEDILRLQVNFAGIIDTNHGFVFFRADLFDSHLLTFTLTGSFAFVISWGDKKMFAISSGGFHPSFRDIPVVPQIPDGFRNLARLGISLINEDYARLSIDTYFAVTSNTVQFGASARLFVGDDSVNLSDDFSFDALFILDPFHFTIDITACVALKVKGHNISGLNITVEISGPELWNIHGEASYSFLFFDISIPFNYTWGTQPTTIAPAAVDLLNILKDELSKTANWKGTIPDSASLHVTLKDAAPADNEILMHPMASLAFSQRSLPLNNYLIEKFGSGKPLDVNKFMLTGVSCNGTDLRPDLTSVTESFAVGNFTNMSDSEKLSRSSFDNLPSGFEITGTSRLSNPTPVDKQINYRLSYLHQPTKTFTKPGLAPMHPLVYQRSTGATSIKSSNMSAKNQTMWNQPKTVVTAKTQFAVANVSDMKKADPNLHASEAEAYGRYNDLIAATPSLAGKIQVVEHYELAE